MNNNEQGTRTRRAILDMGLTLWRVDPSYVTARRIARELDMTHGSVCYHFPHGQQRLRDAIAAHAVQQGESRVIVSLIGQRHKAVAHLDEAQRLEHMRAAAG